MSEEVRLRATLKQWRLKNFKSIRKATLDFAPLTLLVGENSSGKSSVLQSIRLVVQSVRARSDKSGWLPLNGDLVNLGTLDDVRTSGSRARRLWVGGDVDVEDMRAPGLPGAPLVWSEMPHTTRDQLLFERSRAVWEKGTFGFDVGLDTEGEIPAAMAVIHEARFEHATGEGAGDEQGTVRLHLRSGSQIDRLEHADIAWVTLQSLLGTPTPEPVLWYSGILRNPSRARRALKVIAAVFTGPFPTVLFTPVLAVPVCVDAWIDTARGASPATSGTADAGFAKGMPDEDAMNTILNVLRAKLKAVDEAILEAREEVYEDSAVRQAIGLGVLVLSAPSPEMPKDAKDLLWSNPQLVKSRILQMLLEERHVDAVAGSLLDVDAQDEGTALTEPAWSVSRFFASQVHYLGPLREEPRPAYQWPPDISATSLGARGEYTAAVLLSGVGDAEAGRILYPLPPGGDNSQLGSLVPAVEEWLRYFGVAEGLRVGHSQLGPVVTILEKSGNERDLTQVGVGVSQLLPVIVQCLVARPGSVVMLEQPELHLHPALQQRLGDFLLECARSGRQLIVETHSEHIITRLRRHIAESDDDALLDVVQFLFAEKTGKGVTQFRTVKPNQYGGIDEWPKGFFDQSASESREILKAASEKHKGPKRPGSPEAQPVKGSADVTHG